MQSPSARSLAIISFPAQGGKPLKKAFSLLLALTLVLGLLSGCGSTDADTASQSSTETTTESAAPAEQAETENQTTAADSVASAEEPALDNQVDEEQVDSVRELSIENPYSFPLVEDETTVTMWCDLIPPLFNAMPNGMQDNLVLQELQERTGITLEISSTAITTAADTVSLMVASGDYPEIWSGFGSYYTGGISEAIDEDLILDLAEYKDLLPSFFTIVDNFDTYGKNAYTDEGNIGVLNGIWTDPKLDVGLTIRTDYLDELGLEVPTTLDEFYNVLTQMHDTYGATYFMDQDSSDPVNAFAQCFGVVGNASSSSTYAYYMAKDGTEAVYSAIEPGFKDYLETMAQWYSEGLIYSDFLSSSNAIPDTDVLLGGSIGITYYNVSSYTTLMAQVDAGSSFDLTPVEVPVNVETGEAVHLGRQVDYTSVKGYSLSTALDPSSEKFESVCAMLDYLYTDEGSELMNYGVENETFTYDEDGNHVWTDLMVNNPDGLAYSWCLTRYTMGAGSFRIDSSRTLDNYGEAEMNMIEVWNETENDAADSFPSGALSLTAEESAQYSATFSDIRTYTQQNILAFITGSRSIDEFDDYVAEIEGMGIEDCTAILQDALDRYNAR